jgi:hypothetical protein
VAADLRGLRLSDHRQEADGNRSLVGSESKDEDMAKYLAAADFVADQLGCAVVIVHHCGIDATRPRGHTSLTGSVESQLAVKRGDAGEMIVTVEYAKDFAEGTEVYSRLEPITVGIDPDGDDITTLVVTPAVRRRFKIRDCDAAIVHRQS